MSIDPAFRSKFAPVVRLPALWLSLLYLPDPFNYSNHLVTVKHLACFDCFAFTTKIIDCSQGAYPTSVKPIICNEIHVPALIYATYDLARTPVPGRHVPPRPFCPQIQPLQVLNPVDFVVANQPAFPSLQNMITLCVLTNAGFCNLPYSLREGPAIAATVVVVDYSDLHHQSASPVSPNDVLLYFHI